MADARTGRTWLLRGTYLGLTLAILYLQLLPLETTPRRLAPPDWLIALTFAWVLRRPDAVPSWLIAGALLLSDLLLQRPPGLWAAFGLVAAHWLKRRDRHLRDSTFAEEWLTVAVLLGLMTLVYRTTLGLVIGTPGTFTLSVVQYGLTVLAYPLVVAASFLLMGIRHAAPGEYDPMGRTL